MAHASPLRSAQADAVSVCGKILRKGQSLTVPATAIGTREKQLASRGKISIRDSNKTGHKQVVCTL